jgi:hypothetical protein
VVNPLRLELEKVKSELQAREDEISRLRSLNSDRKKKKSPFFIYKTKTKVSLEMIILFLRAPLRRQ